MHAPLPKLPALPSPQRSRSRRERRSDAARNPVLHMVMPGCEVARSTPRKNETITAFLRRTGWAWRDKEYGWQFKKGLPTVLEVNGSPVLRKFWRTTRIAANDNVRFVSYPLGGGGNTAKQVVGLVALVAVAAFAVWAGPALFGPAGALFSGTALTGQLASAAIGLGGALLVNALTAPQAGATNAPDSTQEQIYTVNAQGNLPKLGQPLPVPYGRNKWYPDFAATPWSEFVGNDQFLNILLSVGMGSYEYEKLYISDTVLWDPVNGISPTFANGTQIAFYEPGQPVTLFPTNVDQSAEVTGQQLPDGSGTFGGFFVNQTATSPGAFVGPFAANPPGTQAQSLAIDFVFPAGVFTANQTGEGGKVGYARVGITAEYCQINDAGAQIGPFTTMFSEVRLYGSTSPIRDSIKIDVAPGRYAVRFRRDDAAFDTTLGSNSVVWAGLRSFLKGNNAFPSVSTLAIRIKATSSTQGSYKFGALATRKVPVWNGSTFVTQASRNPGWAFLDAVTNAQYGSQLGISKVDFNAVVNFAAGCTARGDCFDYIFSSAVAVPSAFDKILTAARARHYWLGDTVSVVRDEWSDVPSMLLTDREIVRDSTQVTWTMLGDEDPDAVIVEYIDQDTWLPAQVQYPPNNELFTSVNASPQRIDGIVQRDQAFREAAFYYLQSIYRRENVQIATEYEGRAIQFGSRIRVQSELPMAYGQGGAVVGAAGRVLTLDPAPVWENGPFYVRLRMPNGKWFGPVGATMGANASIANLNATELAAAEAAQSTTLAQVLAREDGGEYPSFELGTADSQSKVCVVLSGVPNGDTCTLTMVVDDERVHATDLGHPPVLPVGQFPSNADLPLIVLLNARFDQGIAEPTLSASWAPAPGAVYYIGQVSYDGGTSWMQVYEGQDNQFGDLVVTPAALTLRVQAVNDKLHGPFASVSLEAPTIEIASETVALDSLIAGIKYQVTVLEDQFNDILSGVQDKISAISGNVDSIAWLARTDARTQISATYGNASAQITEVRTVAVSTQEALAEFSQEVTATFGPDFSSVKTVSQAVATLDGYAAAAWSVTLNVNNAISGIELVNGGSGQSAINFLADAVSFQHPSVNGGAPVPFLTLGTASGVASMGLRGNFFLDGTLTGTMIQAGTINTIHLAAQSITAGKIQAGSITSASGVIGALSVQSLSIGDNAVTVPDISVVGSPITPSLGAYISVNSKTIFINTVGLAGKPIAVSIDFIGYYGGSPSPSFDSSILITANGVGVLGPQETTILTPSVSGNTAYFFTASGGVDTVTVNVLWLSVFGGVLMNSSVLRVMGVKR